MGEPVKIDELARSMIRLMGLEVRDETNPDGDIAVTYVGLREGEKLYEELLIGENTTPTEHALIRRSIEPYHSADKLERELTVLRAAMDENDFPAIEAVLLRTVEGFQAGSGTAGQGRAGGLRRAVAHVALMPRANTGAGIDVKTSRA